jgi:hypothetical protein
MSSRSSAAPPRSRRKSSPVASACSLTRTSTKPVLPVSDTMLGEKLEPALLRKSMSGSAGPCSLELLSWGYRAVKAGSTGIEVCRSDSTLSDRGRHGERAHSRRSVRSQLAIGRRLLAHISGRSARALADSVHGDRRVAHTRRRLERRVIQAGHDERTRLRFSRISIARCADLIRSSASAWGPLSWSVHPVTAARATDQGP